MIRIYLILTLLIALLFLIFQHLDLTLSLLSSNDDFKVLCGGLLIPLFIMYPISIKYIISKLKQTTNKNEKV